MKTLVPSLAEAFLALAVLGLLAAALVPWRSQLPEPSPAVAAAPVPPDQILAWRSPETASPESVFALFVRHARPVAPITRPVINEKGPVDAPWLAFLGFYSSNGEARYVLKDTRSGRVITIGARSASANGWTIVAVEERRLIVRKDSETLVVQKR